MEQDIKTIARTLQGINAVLWIILIVLLINSFQQ